MIIKKATIQNFKSIEYVDIDFSNDCKLFVGLSECGKTNLLLALRTLDKSFSVDKTYIKEGTKTTDKSYVDFVLTFNKEEKEDFMKSIKKIYFLLKPII
jgi:predicted ATP-dependent endonuclease of OLD family